MKILIFTEGTILMHLSGRDVSREERVRQSQAAGVQREDRKIAYETNIPPPAVKKGSVYDLKSYLPVGKAAQKILAWQKQGAKICYLTSRRIKSEIETIRQILKKFDFPNSSRLFYRQEGEDYKDVVERVLPDVLIEDDCESIGGKPEMAYPHLKPKFKAKIESIPVKEFGGIDHLPEKIDKLKRKVKK
jgi:hypothetical protein